MLIFVSVLIIVNVFVGLPVALEQIRSVAMTPGTIDKHIIRTGEPEYANLSAQVVDLYRRTEMQNPGWTTRYFSAAQRRHFICTHFDNRVMRAYDDLLPNAYRADLFRFCAVWMLGGMYADFSVDFLVSLDDLIDCQHDALVLCHDRPFKRHAQLAPSFFAARPRHKFIGMCIDKIVNNVEQRFMGINALHPTGPLMMRNVFDQFKLHNSLNGIRIELAYCKENVAARIDQMDKPVINFKSDFHNTAVTIDGTPRQSYTHMWTTNNVYK
jgi:mannosyltransferase OCH1-like enzyme